MTVSIAHRLQYHALRGVVSALAAISWKRACALGENLGAVGFRPLRIRRGVVERHLAAAFPGLPAAEITRIARAAYEHLGRITIETALLPERGKEGVLELMQGTDGWHIVEDALSAGRGLILVTGHLGNWELGGAYLAARGVPIDVIVRGQSNPLFEDYMNETRSRLGMDVVHDSEAVRRTPRSLRSGRAVAFLADQGVRGLASTFVPFFGRPAKTPRGPAVFALRLHVPVVFAAVIRQPGEEGRYRMSFETIDVPHTGDRQRDVDSTVAAYTSVLERWVRRTPEQYLWQHRRWRRQPPDTPPELREP
ncbi:MAG: lysophospholipid acyltransferase family protein [Gemmatimonadaceae bacterium]